MMFVSSIILVSVLIGTLDAQQLDLDLNRLRLAPATSHLANQLHNNPYNFWGNANDGYSSGNVQSKTPLHLLHDVTAFDAKNPHTPLQIHPPREDARLFYQSDAYLQENNGENVNNEVSFIYPGREVVRAVHENDARPIESRPVRIQQRGSISEPCIRCPSDRTITLKQGTRQVKVPHPRPTTCSGQKAPRNFRFVVQQGPMPGSKVKKGSHLIVGTIMHKGRTLRTCTMQVNVWEPICRAPKYLVAHCAGDQNRTCNFKCRDSRLELIGDSSLTCGDGAKWEGSLPFCGKKQTKTKGRWCTTPSPPRHGQVSCRGKRVGRKGFAEGSKCWVQCARGRHSWNPQATTVCRRGSWTRKLSCRTRRP